jgi:branched-chain amino acid transport system ATP-binding protein
LLSVEELAVHYGRVVALRGVSLTVEKGEIVAVVGPNGAGKSTLLNTIAGRTRAFAGRVVLDAEPILGLPPERIVRKGLALVPEGRHIFQTLTVAENLKLGAMAGDGRGRDIDHGLLRERFPILEKYLDTPAGRLSGGEQQQLAIARAMLARPRLLLLDEPSLGLAPLVVDAVFQLLEQLHEDGTPILLVEQNATRAVALSDRTYVLKSGRVVLEGRSDEIRQAPAKMTSAYLGE